MSSPVDQEARRNSRRTGTRNAPPPRLIREDAVLGEDPSSDPGAAGVSQPSQSGSPGSSTAAQEREPSQSGSPGSASAGQSPAAEVARESESRQWESPYSSSAGASPSAADPSETASRSSDDDNSSQQTERADTTPRPAGQNGHLTTDAEDNATAGGSSRAESVSESGDSQVTEESRIQSFYDMMRYFEDPTPLVLEYLERAHIYLVSGTDAERADVRPRLLRLHWQIQHSENGNGHRTDNDGDSESTHSTDNDGGSESTP
ncbi:hypothetical protein F5Y17DRAFT_426822 [Xylariaceae sp. FL0594]|nr:hypothetical protein F5Y17DRAFT_426822 [Xylariaceae sp. FL0594]